jgi:hypothetical protein
MSERASPNRPSSDLPDELYEMPGQPPANLWFLLGQIVSRLNVTETPTRNR